MARLLAYLIFVLLIAAFVLWLLQKASTVVPSLPGLGIICGALLAGAA